MKINDNKFDKALHHPIYTINKLERLGDDITKTLEDIMKIFGKIKVIQQDLSLYRQELLGSVNTKEEKDGRNTGNH